MSEEPVISLFEEKDEGGQMDKEVESFRTIEDFKGYIFTSKEIKSLGAVEYDKFLWMLKSKQIKFFAGRTKRIKGGRNVDHYVHKKKLKALGMDLEVAYFRFDAGWKDPKEVEFIKTMTDRQKFLYRERAAYADSIDRAVEEAQRAKERRERRKIDYELDDSRGWTRVTPGEHKRVRRGRKRERPSTVDKATFEAEEEEDEPK